MIRNAAKSIQKLDIYDKERPVGIQIFGANMDSMLRSVEIVEKTNPDSIDINIAPMQIGDSVRVRDLNIDGVELLAADSAVLVSVKTSRKAMAAAAAEGAEDGEEGGEEGGEEAAE